MTTYAKALDFSRLIASRVLLKSITILEMINYNLLTLV